MYLIIGKKDDVIVTVDDFVYKESTECLRDLRSLNSQTTEERKGIYFYVKEVDTIG